jgi:tetratricopeptide (TPR) repeat protein
LPFRPRGALLLQTGQFERAMADYNRAVALNPNSHEAFFGRGNVFRRMGDLDHAVSDFSRAIALSPNQVNYYGARGDAFSAKGDLDARSPITTLVQRRQGVDGILGVRADGSSSLIAGRPQCNMSSRGKARLLPQAYAARFLCECVIANGAASAPVTEGASSIRASPTVTAVATIRVDSASVAVAIS